MLNQEKVESNVFVVNTMQRLIYVAMQKENGRSHFSTCEQLTFSSNSRREQEKVVGTTETLATFRVTISRIIIKVEIIEFEAKQQR